MTPSEYAAECRTRPDAIVECFAEANMRSPLSEPGSNNTGVSHPEGKEHNDESRQAGCSVPQARQANQQVGTYFMHHNLLIACP